MIDLILTTISVSIVLVALGMRIEKILHLRRLRKRYWKLQW